MNDSSDREVESCNTTSDTESYSTSGSTSIGELEWDPEYLSALAAAVHNAAPPATQLPRGAGVQASLSSIVRAPFFHLSKWLGAKDVLVPSGPQASFAASVFNLVNSIVGGGILALPATMSWAGLAVVCVALPLLSLVMLMACWMLLDAADRVQGVSYEFLAKCAFGRYGSRFVDGILAVSSFLTLAAFLVLLGDFGTEIYELAFGVEPNRVYVIITIGMVVCFPLSLLPTLNALRFASVIGVMCVAFFVGVLIYLYIDGFDSAPEPTALRSDGFFRAFPVILFAFSCESTMFPIVAEMRADVRPRAKRVVAMSFLIAFVVYSSVAVLGYLLFGDAIQDNIILSIAQIPGSPIVPVLIAFAFNIATAYPLQSFAARLAIVNVFWHDHRHVTERGWFISSWLFVFAAFLAASGVSLGFVLALTGSIASSLLTLILPGLIYIRLTPMRPGHRWWFQDIRKIGAALMSVLGGAVGIAGLIDTFSSLQEELTMTTTTTTSSMSMMTMMNNVTMVMPSTTSTLTLTTTTTTNSTTLSTMNFQ
jgi:amino acid permease